MFQIRPRWPLLALAAAAITYGANNYRLAGLEHLRLEARTQQTPAEGNAPNSWASSGNSSEGRIPSGTPAAVGWHERLSVGEKLAMWEEKLQESTLSPVDPSSWLPSTQPSSAFPVSAPIPIPPGFVSSGKQLLPDDLQEQNPDGPLGGQTTNSGLGFTPGNSGSPPPKSDTRLTTETDRRVIAPVAKRPEPKILGRTSESIRIATFNACSLGVRKFERPPIGETLARMLRQFDVVALQEITSTRDDLLPMLIRKLNESGRNYDYLIGPRVGRVAPQQQFAFVFDTERLETDRYQLYTVDDPQDLLNYEPLVAWFRCKGVSPDKAFTFSLINLQIDPNFVGAEIPLLPKLVDGIQNDGRGEDDWILAGDFAGPVPRLAGLDDVRTMRRAMRGDATTVDGERQLDELLFSARATVEFSGEVGVFDFLRQYNMSLEDAVSISDHLPVWAEFSTYEGLQPGLVVPAGTPSEL